MKKEKKRTDSYRRILKTGESQRKDGRYTYRWTDKLGQRHTVYADTLDELRKKEEQITKDGIDGIKMNNSNPTVDDIFNIWLSLKRGIKETTKTTYIYQYKLYIQPFIGKLKVADLKLSDIKQFYNILIDRQKVQISSVNCVHVLLHQILEIAVDDDIIRKNPTNNAFKELNRDRNLTAKKRRALTIEEQKIFMDYVANSNLFNRWYPLFTFMLYTGLRIGEVTGLRWCDVNFKENNINVNHTLVYCDTDRLIGINDKSYYTINTPKTLSGQRDVPMLSPARNALLQERKHQMETGIRCKSSIDGYEDFIFLNLHGMVYNKQGVNRVLDRIVKSYNKEILAKNESNPVLLPHISCHIFRHTFATRLCESNVNIKVIQDMLGHKNISTTMDVYAEVTKDCKQKMLNELEKTNKFWAV